MLLSVSEISNVCTMTAIIYIPDKTNWESGENDASRYTGVLLLVAKPCKQNQIKI